MPINRGPQFLSPAATCQKQEINARRGDLGLDLDRLEKQWDGERTCNVMAVERCWRGALVAGYHSIQTSSEPAAPGDFVSPVTPAKHCQNIGGIIRATFIPLEKPLQTSTRLSTARRCRIPKVLCLLRVSTFEALRHRDSTSASENEISTFSLVEILDGDWSPKSEKMRALGSYKTPAHTSTTNVDSPSAMTLGDIVHIIGKQA